MSVHYPITGEAKREATAPELFLGPLSHLALQKKTWSPTLLAGVLWRAVCNIGRHHRVMEVLRYPEYADLIRSNPRFGFKYLTHGYLSWRFSVAQRAASFTHHYKVLRQLLPDPFLARVLHGNVTLAEMHEADTDYTITFGFSTTHDKEGELSLNLEVDGKAVFVMSFTIVPGKVAQSPSSNVLLITRIQGVKGCYKEISSATRNLHDVAPAALLLAALQGIGEALGICSMACISGKDQNSYCEQWQSSFETAYDRFFNELGVNKNAAALYLTDIPIKDKPLTLVKHGHKLRTREKREFKREIQELAAALVSGNGEGDKRPVARLHVQTLAEQI